MGSGSDSSAPSGTIALSATVMVQSLAEAGSGVVASANRSSVRAPAPSSTWAK